jgi:tRNA (guanine26-N2/guanine27-N2)-dimethyltransferase
MNTEYHSEVGLRILLGFVVRETVKYDRGIEPVLCYAREHFTRLHLRILRGAKAADATLARTGFIHQCRSCPYREEQAGLHAISRTCPLCGEPLNPIGPLWLGSIRRDGICNELRLRAGSADPGSKKDILKLLDTCEEELPTSSFYDYHVLAKRLGCSPPTITVVLDRIRKAGHAASRTHFSGYGIRAEAPLGVILEAISAQQ